MQGSQLLRYILVGVVNTAFSYSVYIGLAWLGLHFSLANLLATVAGILFSFRTHGVWVFGNRDWRALWRFVPMWLFLYAVNVGQIAVFVRAGLHPYLAGAVALPPTVLLAFVLQKRFVYRDARRTVPVES